MKHWRFYLAIIILIILMVTFKEGFDIPANASARATPIDLMNTMQSVMAGNKTYDMIDNKNLLYEKTQTESYHNDATELLGRDKNTLKDCNTNLTYIKSRLEDMQSKVKTCNLARDEENRLYSDCELNTKPTAIRKWWDTYGTYYGLRGIFNQCNGITWTESSAVDKCIADTNYYNSH